MIKIGLIEMQKSKISMFRQPLSMNGKTKIAISILAVAVMMGAAFFAGGLSAYAVRGAGLSAASKAATSSASSTAWTYPTTTMQEPGYTNGTYNWAATASVEHLNVYLATDAYSFALLDQVYDPLTQLSPNATPAVMPWLATSWSEAPASANMTTFDPVTGQTMPVAYIWTVNLRPGVQWTDWTPANAASTYTFSNTTTFNAFNASTGAVQSYTHQYKWPSLTMRTEYVQSADVILTWKILQSSLDFSGDYINVVNVVPTSNLSVKFYLSAQSASFLFYTLETMVLPYHIWVNHDFASSITTAWNYTGAKNGYDTWNMNYNPTTGTASGLVGSGPFMFNGGYGMPKGSWIPDAYWTEYVNPHYFVQYGPSWMRQYTPKFYELHTPQYLSVSAAATAELLGQVDTIQFGLPPTFLPTIKTMPSTYIYHKKSTSYGYMQLNSYSTNSPYNVTAFRQALNYATDKAYLASVIDEGYAVLGQPIIPVSDSVWHNYSAPQYSYNPSLAWSMINSTPGFYWHPAVKGTTYPQPGQWYYGASRTKATAVTANMQITVASEDPLGVEGALIIAKEWTAIGVPTTITQEAFTTLVSNLITYSYSSINLGITGIFGDPTGDFFSFYNSSIGLGTGFYLGPFSSLTINGKLLTGSQVDSLMNNLTNELNVQTNFSQRLSIAYEIQGIAAQESTMINLGYPIDILPFTNSTFTGVIKDSLPYLGFMYWNFLSLHLRTAVVKVTPPKTVPIQLHVGVVTPGTVYFNGQIANATIQVRNQYGQPVSGAEVDVGYSPQGALVNITSYKLVTNSAGEAVWQFKVLDNNPLIYTSDYVSEINISAAAVMPPSYTGTSVPGIGWTHVAVSSQPVAYKVVSSPTLVNGAGWKKFEVEVYNPMTGVPISGYQYTIQSLNGAVYMLNTSANQSISNTSSYNPIYGFGFDSAPITNPLIVNSTIPVTSSAVPTPTSMAFDPASGLLFVASNSTGAVYAINPFNPSGIPQMVANITVGKNPDALLANGLGLLYVANKGSDNVTVINTTTLATMMNISVGLAPSALAMNATGFVFVANYGSDSVSVINTTGVVNATYKVGTDPSALAFNATGFLVVANELSNNLTVINTTSGAHTQITSGVNGPDALAINASGDLLVANKGTGNLTVYSGNTLTGSVHVGASPDSILPVSANYTLVSNALSNNITVVNTTMMKTVFSNLTGIDPVALAESPANQVYVANMKSYNLTQLSILPVKGTMNITAENANTIQDYGLASVSGVTPTNGTISVLLSAAPTTNFSVAGSVFESYVFLGNYAAGGAVGGIAPYGTIGEMTSATNNNPILGPEGFGVQQPVGLPIQVENTTVAPNVSIAMTVVNSTISPNGQTTVTLTVTNSTTGKPVANYTVVAASQNALGANRGLLLNSSGVELQAFNPNVFFGSTYLPGISVVTNATGKANLTFTPQLYQPAYAPSGTFVGYNIAPYVDNYLIPYDEFQLSAVGMGGEVASALVYSNQSVNSVAPSPVVAAYISGESSINGVTVLPANGTYTMYVNSTLNSAAGPSASGITVSVSVSLGNVSVSSGTTASNGSFVLLYNAPNVSVLTAVTISVTTSSGTTTQTVYLVPHYVITTTVTSPPVTKTKTVVSVPLYAFGLIGIFVILTVIFAVLYVSSRGKKGGSTGGGNTTNP